MQYLSASFGRAGVWSGPLGELTALLHAVLFGLAVSTLVSAHLQDSFTDPLCFLLRMCLQHQDPSALQSLGLMT